MTDSGTESMPVSVSAANYAQLSSAQLYAQVVAAPIDAHPIAPPVPKPTTPVFYLLLPGEVYPNDVSLAAVYHELEMALEPRGYFNAVYQMRAGHMPAKIDYLLRVHFGERPWLTPIVRTDTVTWGNDGLISNRYKTHLMSVTAFDPRVGLGQEESMNLDRALNSMGSFGMGPSQAEGIYFPSSWNSFGNNGQLWRDFGDDGSRSQDFFLLVVEAFKADDVKAMDRKAPCIWATFVAVPADRGQKFSGVLHAMAQTAAPYFGETTHGLQAYEVPPGKVFVGTPVEIPGIQIPSFPADLKDR